MPNGRDMMNTSFDQQTGAIVSRRIFNRFRHPNTTTGTVEFFHDGRVQTHLVLNQTQLPDRVVVSPGRRHVFLQPGEPAPDDGTFFFPKRVLPVHPVVLDDDQPAATTAA